MISNSYRIVVDELNRVVLYDDTSPNKSYETTISDKNVMSVFDTKDYNYSIFNNKGTIILVTDVDKYKFKLVSSDSTTNLVDYMSSGYFRYIKEELNTELLISELFFSVKLIIESCEGTQVFDVTNEYKTELAKLDADPNYSFENFQVPLNKLIDINCYKARLVLEPNPALDSNIFYAIVPITTLVFVYDDLKYNILKELVNVRVVDIKMQTLRNNMNTLSDIYVRYLIAEQLLNDSDYCSASMLLECINQEFINWKTI